MTSSPVISSTLAEPLNWSKSMVQRARGHQELVFTSGLNGLEITARSGKQIEISTGERLTEFLSCSYLGLESDARLVESAVAALRRFGVQFAAARSRASVSPAHEYDELLSTLFGGKTITFNSVTNAHLGILPLLASGELPSYPLGPAGPVWILDKAAHASMQILQGIIRQFGSLVRLPINQVGEVEAACATAAARGATPIVLTDTVGSMQGLYPVRELFRIVERHGGYLYADDAHGTSIHGPRGAGYAVAESDGRLHPNLILLSSLSKGFGATGGAVTVPTQRDAEMIRRHCSTYIFGGPLSLGGVAAGVASARIHLSSEIEELQQRLWKNVASIDSLLGPELGNHHIASPIRFIRVGDEQQAIRLALALRKDRFAVTTAMFPAVPRGQAILRLALSAAHRPEELVGLAGAVRRAREESCCARLIDRGAQGVEHAVAEEDPLRTNRGSQ